MNKKFENELFHKFMYLARFTSKKTHEKLEELGLHRGQPVLLFNLWEKDGLSGRALSEAMNVQPATVTKMVQRLKSKEFVYTLQDRDDSRVSRVFLSEKGKAVESDVRNIFKELHQSIFEGLSQEKLDLLEEIFDVMKTNLNKMN